MNKFDEILADANPSKTGARQPVASAGSTMPPKVRMNSSGSGKATDAMQVDEQADAKPANEAHNNEHSVIQPGEEDDYERAVTFLCTYDPPEPVEHPGDEFIWPVLGRTLGVRGRTPMCR